MTSWLRGLTLVLLLVPAGAGADIVLPPGFRAQVYLSGEGFDAATARGGRGIPAVSTAAFDAAGALYLGRTGRRYSGGEVEDIWPVYRIPPGGGRLTPATERGFLLGPPVPNPSVGAVRDGRELLITTFDRERRIGVLYRLLDGRIEMMAGGTPEKGESPLLRQPEGVAVDAGGRLYVADRDQGAVVRLEPSGRVLERRWVAVTRPRVLAFDPLGYLWIGADGQAEAPWQQGPGEIWRVSPAGEAQRLLSGPVAQGITVSPGGTAFVADRHGAQVFALTADGARVDFARFTDNDTPRGLVFAPATPATRAAGIAGDLFIITIQRGAWPVNEVIRISGPFDEHVRQRAPR